jgi:ribonuclease P protein component
MLSQRQRIPRKLFAEILTSRRFFHSLHFSLRLGLSNEKQARVAVSVSKKVSKSAVVRNTVRRRAYSVVSPLLASLPTGLYLIMAKVGAEKIKGEALQKEISALLKATERS